ncbi:hypothetical protein JMG10_05820 [Nostoc ellipsosporum NOK]|nr:hypothetical protein [Nostoc ellipsosporum NOK]
MIKVFQANYILSAIIVVLLLLILMSISVVVLRRLRFIQKPLVLVGTDEALISGGYLIAMLLLCTAVVPGIFRTGVVYFQNTGFWIKPFLMVVAELSVFMLVFQALLFGLIKLGLLLIGARFSAKSSDESGPALSYWTVAVAIGTSYILRELLMLIADERVPRLIRMTY